MKNLYLYARNGHFYFKIKVPVALCKKFGCPLFRKSLKTKSMLEAQHVSNILKDRFKDLFRQAKMGTLSKDEARECVSEIFKMGFEGLEELKSEGVKIPSLLDESPPALNQLLAENITTPFEPIIDRILSHRSNKVEKDSSEYKRILSDTVKSFIEICQNEKGKASSNYLMPTPQSRSQKTMKRLSKLIGEYVKEHVTDNKWGEKTKVEFNTFFKILLEIVGDVDINSIDREKINAFKEKLLRIPPNRNKNPIYRGKGIDEILSMDDVTPMSVARVNKNLAVISSMFKWGKKFGYVRDNPAEGLQVKLNHRVSDERKVYDLSLIHI